MSIRFLAVATALFIAPFGFTETLSEAVQQGLIANPEVIFNFTDLPLVARVAHAEKNPLILKDQAITLNQLKFNEKKSMLTRQGSADDLALQVVNHYFQVLLHEKLTHSSHANLAALRNVFLQLKQQEGAKRANTAVLRVLSTRLARAESLFLKSQTSLHQIKKGYASLVGKWPLKLIYPVIPTNQDLPLSVGAAIEQSLDNYLATEFSSLPRQSYPPILAGTNTLKNRNSSRSITNLSQSVRSSWEHWTASGLKLNQLRKNLLVATEERRNQQEKFKNGLCSLDALLQAQQLFFKAELACIQGEYNETMARFRILSATGKLISFINSGQENTVVKEPLVASNPALSFAPSDTISYPYPDYTPRFGDQFAKSIEMGALNAVKAEDQRNAQMVSRLWYVSAGNFKNKANALALANRLKGLGFIAFMQPMHQDSVVLIGPYEYQKHALTGMQRLKDIAHVQGVLLYKGKG